MSDVGKEIMNTFGEIVPKLTELQREKLLSFSEGISYAVSRREQEASEAERQRETA